MYFVILCRDEDRNIMSVPVTVLYTAVTLSELFLDEGRLLTVSRVERVQGKKTSTEGPE